MSMLTANLVSPYGHVIPMLQELADSEPPIKDTYFKLYKTSVDDIMRLQLRDEQKKTFSNEDINYVIQAHSWINLIAPINGSLYFGEDLLLLFSVQEVATGVGEISFLTDIHLVNAPIAVKLRTIKLFKEAIDLLPFRRLQAKVDSTFPIAIRFIEGMKFEREGVLRAHGVGNIDYYMYGYVK